MAEDRRYDDREVGLILKRVAELHEADNETAQARSLTKTEIEGVVAELGISKALVARAVSQISVQDVRNRPVWALGGKTDLMYEEIIDGTIDESTHMQMLEVLRRSLGDPGELRTEGSGRFWSASRATTRSIFFSAIEHEGKTTLRLEERMPMDARATVGVSAAMGSFGGFVSIIPLKVLVAKSVLLLSMGPLVAVGATVGWLGGRALWKRHSTRRERQLHRAFGDILALAPSS